MRILVDFSSLYTKDYAIVKSLDTLYNLKEGYNSDLFNNSEDNIKFKLLLRESSNPLEASLDPAVYNHDSLLLELLNSSTFNEEMKKYYSSTDLDQLISLIDGSSKDTSIGVTIFCNDLFEEQYIRKQNPEYDITRDLTDDYQIYIISDVKFFDKIPLTLDKEYYLAKTKYNLVKDQGQFRLPDRLYGSPIRSRIKLFELFKIRRSHITNG